MKKVAKHKKELMPEQQSQEQSKEFLIVGIGASAGGIQALEGFFHMVPDNSNIAYVVILHLSPSYDSQLTSILQRETSIPVSQVTVKTLIEPNHIYVIPPDRHLIIEEQCIAPLLNLDDQERRSPVDIFLRTLADQFGPRAVCVILSGTGGNGSMGLKRIREQGGATYVQNPREAEYNEMPRNAIATGLVDDVLNVSEIPSRIIVYRNSLGKLRLKDHEEGKVPMLQDLREIFTQLKVRTGHDFSNYKRPTLLRRIERRINLHSLAGLPAYISFIQEHPEETHALLKELLISVTNFFRDLKAFTHLEEAILPAIFADKNSDDQVRIWVAGCATGEEAYSIAMLCAELADGIFDAPKIQIFASDIDEAAIATAREGWYSLLDAADVSSERLRRFFNKEVEGYRVKSEIREMILFAQHNFLKDPPFSKLDLVTCRNVLIYLNSIAQDKVMETFHFALKPKAYLFLGSSESVNGTDLYTVDSREYHIFQAREVTSRNYPMPESVTQFNFSNKQALNKFDSVTPNPRASFGELHQKMLEQYAPPSVVVNQEYDIVHMSESAGRYFEFSGGEPSQNLLKLIRPQLRLELRSALYQAVQNKMVIEARNLKLMLYGQQQSLDIQVRPALEEHQTAKGFILIIFKSSLEVSQENTGVRLISDEPIAKQIEEELIAVKAQLRNSVEQYEYQAEELKASNEELQAMNEELRSAAEELETSKEELQSINEELRTVNQELKMKIEETGIASNNLQNLVNSANVGTIFLDRSFSIRLFTPAILDLFNLKTGDYGRPITDITHKLQYDGLLEDAQVVLEKLSAIEREITTIDHRFFMVRLLPYRTDEDKINGVVITFFDITARRESEEALRRSEEKYRLQLENEVSDRTKELQVNYALLQTIYNTTLIGMSVFSPIRDEVGEIIDFRIISVNKKMEQAYGPKNMNGKLYSEVFSDNKQIDLYKLMVKTMQTGEPGQMEYKNKFKNNDSWYSTMFVKGEDLLVSTNLDITERKILEQKRLRAFALLQQSEELAGIATWDYDLHTRDFSCSDRMYHFFDRGKENVINPDVYLEYVTQQSLTSAERVVAHILAGDEDFEETIQIEIHGEIKVIHQKGTVLRDELGVAVRVLGVDMDMTAMYDAERRLSQLETSQQQEIFQATLSAQEDERRRISESLHNGVGQILYGTRVAMNNLTVEMAIEKPDKFNEYKAYTANLLTTSIKDIRSISHDLMPTVLAEFGLKAAVKEVCEQLQNGIVFDCTVSIASINLDNYLELAAFRTVQELMINVVKHANATHADVLITDQGNELLISVSDNGQGMPIDQHDQSGIGLRSIKTKVDLLKGTLDIQSKLGKGTVIKVSLPHQ